MPIENRELKPGTKLVARYKGKDHSALLVETEQGLRYRLEDGREFKSPSSAGSAIMGGNACNGWRFWSLADEATTEKPKKERKSKKAKANGAGSLIERMEDGRYFCSACMEAFEVTDDQEPSECPKGHKGDGTEG